VERSIKSAVGEKKILKEKKVKCPKCKCVFSEEERFCPRCGRNMEDVIEKLGFFPKPGEGLIKVEGTATQGKEAPAQREIELTLPET
jgi:predicted amidophosphoribosyltransferase